jgi:ATP-dependent exoDNAse (exonuclease V) beta subunit
VQRLAPGCPAFTSKDSVLERPDGDPASSRTVCPGLHVMGTPEEPYSVAWWSPSPDVLRIDAERSHGLRRDDLIVKDVPPPVLREYLDAYHAWRASRDEAVATARTPTLDVITASEAAAIAIPALDEIAVTIETAGAAPERPGGARFGTLVHALLADVPLGPEGEALLPALAAAQGRVLGAPEDEVTAAEAAVRTVLRHPVLRAAADAAAAGRCHREAPVTWRPGTGPMIEGHVDLAYVADDEFVVVDFKTDRELDGALERYQRQVQIYAAAIGAATGRRARAVLMRV